MKQVTKEISVVSHSAVDNSFLHVFVGITVANAAVIEGKSCVGVVVGPCPFFLVVLLLLRRNASLAGGFAGRLVVWWWFCFCDLICLFSVQANCAYVPFLSLLMSLSGPCHSAITANPEEKKNWRPIGPAFPCQWQFWPSAMGPV